MFARTWQHFEEGVIGLLLVATTLLVFIEVVARFGFSTGFIWMEELTLHLAGWLVLFGASWGVKIGAHIGVDAVVRLLPHSGKRFFAIIASLASLVYCGLLIYGSWIYLAKIRKIEIEMEDIPLEKWIAHSILVIGFALLAVRIFEILVRAIRGDDSGFHQVNEAQEALQEFTASEDAGEQSK
jgi:C4-dicarboxylate transporter DctQ subunit